ACEPSGGELDRSIDRLLSDMLAADPSERPSAREVVDRLRALLQPRGTLVASTIADDPGRTTAVGPWTQGDAPAPVVPAPLRGRLGRYTILEKLGEGGMGTVYRAEDPADGSMVAIKVLRADWSARPGALTRFRKEARLLAE